MKMINLKIQAKTFSLIFLCLQNLSFSLLINKRRDTPDGRVVVLLTEVVKLFISFVGLLLFCPPEEYLSVFNKKTLLMSFIPSLFYSFQNNLCYISLSRIPPLYFGLLYQTKILTTALFSMIIFNRKFTNRKIFALVLLFCGVFLVQADLSSVNIERSGLDIFIGTVSLFTASIFSGFTGVYTEWFLKKPSSFSNKKNETIFIPTLQSSLFGFIFSVISLISPSFVLTNKKIFDGISNRTYLIVLNQSIGGLLVAVVTKYADSVLKTFSTCISIVLFILITKGFSQLNFLFKIGSFFVMSAIILYN